LHIFEKQFDLFTKPPKMDISSRVLLMPINHITRTEINIGERPVPLIARVNRRAKRLILKVDPVAGEILVTAPTKRSLPEAIAFAHERSEWIAGQLDEKLRARAFAEGMRIPFRGTLHTIIRDGGPRAPVRIDNEFLPVIRIGGDGAHLNRRLVDWMKREARKALTERVGHYCAQLGKKHRALRIRDTRSRWGSCSSDATLSFSWRLIMAPDDILSYVAAHECVHLEHMNHSPAFWRRVATLGVDARAAENWFNAHGAALFSHGVQAA
jgi:predicted metal-dependent hydrolase